MTTAQTKAWPSAKLTYLLVVSSWVIYAVLTLLAPQAVSTSYKLNELQLILLRLTVIVPIHLIWLIAAHGAVTLKKYAQMIQGAKEAAGINHLADGLLWTLAYLIASSLLSAIVPFYINLPGYDALVVLRDHLAPAMSLVAFWLLFLGSQELKAVAKFDTWAGPTMWAVAGFAIIAFVLVLEFATAPVVAQSQADLTSVSIVNHGVLIYTLILPYIAAWFLGVLACVNITKYSHRVGGVIYRRALRDVVIGICLVIALAVIIQLLSFASKFLLSLAVLPLLVVVYLLLFIYGLGFVFIRAGAKRLASIEVQT
jgi:hypothetical protein